MIRPESSRGEEIRLLYHVLGPIAAHDRGADLRLGGPKPKSVLAALLLDANRVVSEERLITLVWGDEAPPSVRGQLQVHISGLRKLLGATTILRRPPGYLVRVEPGELDLHQVDEAVVRAKAEEGGGDAGRAATLLRAGLARWTGQPLGGGTEPLLAQAGPGLRERRPGLLEELFEAELGAGRHADVVGELLQVTRENPFRERLYAQLMLALHRCGRTAEALDVYADVRGRLTAELGVEPGRPLRQTHRRILRGEADGNDDGTTVTAPAARRDSIGYLHQHRGSLLSAVQSYQRAVEIFRELGDRQNEARTLVRLGDTYQAAGQPEAARHGWRQAAVLLADMGHPDADDLRARVVEPLPQAEPVSRSAA